MCKDNYMLSDMYLGKGLAMGDIETIERSMIALRRSQRRRSLARLSGAPPDPAVEVIDVIEAAELARKPATVSTVADALSIDQPRASKLVAAAVQAGLVERRADQADGRRSFLARTPAGVAVTEQVHRCPDLHGQRVDRRRTGIHTDRLLARSGPITSSHLA